MIFNWQLAAWTPNSKLFEAELGELFVYKRMLPVKNVRWTIKDKYFSTLASGICPVQIEAEKQMLDFINQRKSQFPRADSIVNYVRQAQDRAEKGNYPPGVPRTVK